jgi:malonyl-CoA O-methyltransferase
MSKKLKKHVSEKYIESAIVQKEIINRLMERLSFINLSPRKVADLGSGVGLSTESLLKLHPNSEFYMMDYSFKSLNSNILQNKSVNSVCADFKNIPFENNTFDFVFSSSALHWELDIKSSFEEVYRILKPGGLFLFSTYGPDTLIELRSAWAQIDDYKHVNDFYDMHDIGDLMLNLNFMDSVLDTEKIIIQYDNVKQLQKDLKNIGSKVLRDKDEEIPLQGNIKMRLMYQEYEKFRSKSGELPATYEVIYGSAWKKMDNIIQYSK